MKKFVVKLITHDGNYDNKKDQIDCSVVGIKDNFEAAKDFMKNKQEKIIEEYIEDRDECEMVYKDGVGTKKYGTWIRKGDRICQFRIIENQPPIEFEEVEVLGNKDRKGFGSTGGE